MAGHTSEKRWENVSTTASGIVAQLTSILINTEESYQQMLEIYAYAGGTDELLAELLFKVTRQRS